MSDYVKIEKEVWESTLRASMDRAGELENTKKQLKIAVERIEFLKKKTAAPYYKDNSYLKTIYQMCDKTLRQIEELDK